ncbi:hypothetical protein MPLSOD_120324 [Mesorhizobium sp. SOD10]|nr:hypothetical protein MPLSOD_120324 [Mesorhizobium sp. SOD10]
MFSACPDEETGSAIIEQEDDWPHMLKTQQMRPADPQRTRPHPGVLGPLREVGGGRKRPFVRCPEFVRIELDTVIAGDLEHCFDPRLDPIESGGAARDPVLSDLVTLPGLVRFQVRADWDRLSYGVLRNAHHLLPLPPASEVSRTLPPRPRRRGCPATLL